MNRRLSRSLSLLAVALASAAMPVLAEPAGDEINRAITMRSASLAARDSLAEALATIQLYATARGVRPGTPGVAGYRPVEQGPYTLYFAQKGRFHARKNPFDPIDPRALILGPDAWKHPAVKPARTWDKAGCTVAPANATDPAPGASTTRHGPLVIAAVGNLDDDADPDCWSIANVNRQSPDGDEIPAGVPFHDASDWNEALLTGIPETEQLLMDELELLARHFGEAWHQYDLPPMSLAEVRLMLPDRAMPQKDPWGTDYALIEIGPETFNVVSAGADKTPGTGDDAAVAAPRRADDTDARQQAAIIDALAAKGITDRNEIDKALAEEQARLKRERDALRTKILEQRGVFESR